MEYCFKNTFTHKIETVSRIQIKQKVYDLGFEKFEESVEKLSEKLDEIINTVCNNRIEGPSRIKF